MMTSDLTRNLQCDTDTQLQPFLPISADTPARGVVGILSCSLDFLGVAKAALGARKQQPAASRRCRRGL